MSIYFIFSTFYKKNHNKNNLMILHLFAQYHFFFTLNENADFAFQMNYNVKIFREKKKIYSSFRILIIIRSLFIYLYIYTFFELVYNNIYK